MNCLAVERILLTDELCVSEEIQSFLMTKNEIKEARKSYITSLPFWLQSQYNELKDKGKNRKGAKEPKFDTKKMSKKELEEYEVYND